jgi:hypothetical protein
LHKTSEIKAGNEKEREPETGKAEATNAQKFEEITEGFASEGAHGIRSGWLVVAFKNSS